MKAIDPFGNFVETDQIWWWQLPDNASPAQVRLVCARNALCEVARRSPVSEIYHAIITVLAHYALVVGATPSDIKRSQMETILDWALVHPHRSVQSAADELWQLILRHHRAEWEAETQRLVDHRNDPATPPHELRQRPQGQIEDE